RYMRLKLLGKPRCQRRSPKGVELLKQARMRHKIRPVLKPVLNIGVRWDRNGCVECTGINRRVHPLFDALCRREQGPMPNPIRQGTIQMSAKRRKLAREGWILDPKAGFQLVRI